MERTIEHPSGLAYVFCDWAANRTRPKSQFVLVLFRCASLCRRRFGTRHPLSLVVGTGYRVVVDWIMGIEIPWQVQVGPRLRLFHGHAVVVNPTARLGADVHLRHGVTIGNRRDDFDCPEIGDRVELGAYSAVLGSITIGDDARIGAHTVVLVDVPDGATAVGNPARVTHRAAHDG